MNETPVERSFDRGAWLTLILTVALLLFSLGSLVYRFTLPTDGWLSGEPEEIDSVGYIYRSNIMGLPSRLESGDHLIGVEGYSLTDASLSAPWSLRNEWQAGTTIRYVVMRGDQELAIDVPLTHWNLITYWRGAGRTAVDLAGYAGLTIFLAVGLLAFWRNPNNLSARALWVLAAVVYASFLVVDLLPTTIADTVDPLASIGILLLIGALFSILLPPAMIRFALVFPKPSPLLQRHSWLALLPYAVGLVALVAFILELYVVTWGWTAASALIAVAILIYNAITTRDAVSRAQLRWGLGGMVVGLTLWFLSSFLGLFIDVPAPIQPVLDVMGALSWMLMGVALGVAVMRYRLFDIDVIIRRTTSYAILTALLVLVYFGSVVVLQRILAPVTGESTIAIVLSTLLIAALFLPLRRRVQAAIDRRFFRQKYDAEQVLAQFAATVRDETDLDALTAELVRVIQETMQPESVSVWLARSSAMRKWASSDECKVVFARLPSKKILLNFVSLRPDRAWRRAAGCFRPRAMSRLSNRE